MECERWCEGGGVWEVECERWSVRGGVVGGCL